MLSIRFKAALALFLFLLVPALARDPRISEATAHFRLCRALLIALDPKAYFASYNLTTARQNKLVIALLEDGRAEAMGRSENPVMKEANDKVVLDPALVDALENWWRAIWMEELRSDPNLWAKIIKDGSTGDRAFYSGYKEVIVLLNDGSAATKAKWNAAYTRAALRYFYEIQPLFERDPELKARFERARGLITDPRTHHMGAFVTKGSGYDMLALATMLGREARGITPRENGVPNTMTDSRTNIARLKKRFDDFFTASSGLRRRVADPKIVTRKGGLTNDVNAILRKVPTMTAETYAARIESELRAWYRGKKMPHDLLTQLEAYYHAEDRDRPALGGALRERLKRELGELAVTIFDNAPPSGYGQKIRFVREEIHKKTGVWLDEAQAEAVTTFFSAADRFDPPTLKEERVLLNHTRAKDAHFGFDVAEQGADNARELQEHLLEAVSLRQALELSRESERKATARLNRLVMIPRQAAKDVGLLREDDGSYTHSGDDGSLDPQRALQNLSRTGAGRELRNRYYRRIAELIEAESPEAPILHRMRGGFNSGGGDPALLVQEMTVEKDLRARLAKDIPWSNLKKVMFIVEFHPNGQGGGEVDVVVTPGYGYELPASALAKIKATLKAVVPPGWKAGEVISNAPRGRQSSVRFLFPRYAIARTTNPAASFG